jgi:hypothetical protein
MQRFGTRRPYEGPNEASLVGAGPNWKIIRRYNEGLTKARAPSSSPSRKKTIRGQKVIAQAALLVLLISSTLHPTSLHAMRG